MNEITAFGDRTMSRGQADRAVPANRQAARAEAVQGLAFRPPLVAPGPVPEGSPSGLASQSRPVRRLRTQMPC